MVGPHRICHEAHNPYCTRYEPVVLVQVIGAGLCVLNNAGSSRDPFRAVKHASPVRSACTAPDLA